MRYVEARIDEYQREEAYRIYVTRSLQLAPRGESLVTSYDEILNPKKQDTRTGDEIAIDIISRAGLRFNT